MANVKHAALTGADLHETKGASLAADHAVLQASSGIGVWSSVLVPSKITLSTPVWDDVVVPPQSLIGGGANAPGFSKLADNGSGSTGVFAYQFDATTEENLYFVIQLPHRYSRGTNLRPHVHWCPTSTNTGSVVWGLEYFTNIGGAVIGATTIVTVTQAASGTSLRQHIASFPEIVGTGLIESAIINCRLFRKAADAADTYTADAALLGVDFHFQVDKMGSDTEIPTS